MTHWHNRAIASADASPMSRLPCACLALAITLLAAPAPARASAPAPIRDRAPRCRSTCPRSRIPKAKPPAWWFRDGAAQAAQRGAMSGKAKNVILFVGDGMSLTTVAAARILDGQRKGGPGEENRLSWERFPATALSKTYNTDSQTPDSAGTMTAMATGVKTRAGVLSIGQQATRGDCAQALAGADADAVGTGRQPRPGHRRGHHHARHPRHARRDLHPFAPIATGKTTPTCPTRRKAAGCIDIARQLMESPLRHTARTC